MLPSPAAVLRNTHLPSPAPFHGPLSISRPTLPNKISLFWWAEATRKRKQGGALGRAVLRHVTMNPTVWRKAWEEGPRGTWWELLPVQSSHICVLLFLRYFLCDRSKLDFKLLVLLFWGLHRIAWTCNHEMEERTLWESARERERERKGGIFHLRKSCESLPPKRCGRD